MNKRKIMNKKLELMNHYYTDLESIEGKVYILDLKNKIYKNLKEKSSGSKLSVLYINIFLAVFFLIIHMLICDSFLPVRYREMPLYFNNSLFLCMVLLLYVFINYLIASKSYQHYVDLLYRYIYIKQDESTIIFISKKANSKLDMTFLENMEVITNNHFLELLAARKIDKYHFDDRDVLLTVNLLEQTNIARYIKDHKHDFSFEVYTDCKLTQSTKEYDLYSGKINVSTGKEIVEKRTTFRVYKVYNENDMFKNGMISNDN